MQSFALIAFVPLLLGAQQPSRTSIPSDAFILRAVMRDWLWESYSPLCIDARILADSGSVTPEPSTLRDGVWSTATLDVLNGKKTAIPIDAATSPYGSRYPACLPERALITYSFSRPHHTPAGLIVVVRAYSAATPDHDELDTRTRLQIGRRHGRWAVVGHPDEHFQVMGRPKATKQTVAPTAHSRP